MVTEQEMKQFEGIEIEKKKESYRVTPGEMEQFNTAWELQDMIGNRKKQFQDEHNLKVYPAYDKLEELCQISVTTMKKTISGTQKISRNFLYKFVVGLHMSGEEANEYFALCGGELNLKKPADFICYRALEDGDSIFQFIEDFEHYTGLKIALR